MIKQYRLDNIISTAMTYDETLLEKCVALAPPGLKLEFGVASGSSINRIAAVTEDVVYGFDCFEGLPEAWNGMGVGAFGQGGNLPTVASNVRLIKGLFQDTLDDFLAQHPGQVGLCHVDCDIYSGAAFVLGRLKDRFVNGSVLIFDELAHYPDYRQHEYKAFLEFLDETGYDFEFIGRGCHSESFCFRILIK